MRKNKNDDQAVSPVIAIILMVAITVVLAGVLYVWVIGFKGSGGNEPKINGAFSNTQHGTDYNFTWDVAGQSGTDISIGSFEIQILDNAGTVIAQATFTDATRTERTYSYDYPGQGLAGTGGNLTIKDNNKNAKLDVGDKIIVDPDAASWAIGYDINFLYKGKQFYTTEIP